MCIFPPAQTIVLYYKHYVPVCALSFTPPPPFSFLSLFFITVSLFHSGTTAVKISLAGLVCFLWILLIGTEGYPMIFLWHTQEKWIEQLMLSCLTCVLSYCFMPSINRLCSLSFKIALCVFLAVFLGRAHAQQLLILAHCIIVIFYRSVVLIPPPLHPTLLLPSKILLYVLKHLNKKILFIDLFT
jgi:hypothetical protein